jgi:hypothetical protein
MKSYYDEILETIENHIKNKEYDEAKSLILSELKMPYVPVEFEKKLEELNKDIKSESGNQGIRELSEQDIEKYLFADDELQLVAVNKLNTLNLRNYLELISKYLASKPNPSAAALLIDSCIEQKIDETLIYQKDEIDYEFTPVCCLRPFESDGFNEAQSYLEEWFSNEDPSFYEFCLQQLIHECFDYLPLSYELEEGYELALMTTKFVLNLTNRSNEWDNLEKKLKFRQETPKNHLLS